MRVCCLPCFERTGRLVPATNKGDTWRCDDCAEAAYQRQQDGDAAAFHGGSGAFTNSERTEEARRLKR